ncbi:MAG TPA: hypothetical protein VIG25_13805 [Pyrinomonadaceae bacterium]|jgi:hypothetical protein
MKRALIRLLPFLITFAFGVVLTVIVGGVVPRHHTWTSDCPMRNRNEVVRGFRSVSQDETTFVLTQIQNSGWTGLSYMSLGNSISISDKLTMKEQALYLGSTSRSGFGSSTNFVVSYISPDTIDDQPVTQDAKIISIPRPRFWRDEEGHWGSSSCNAMVRVNLDSSGTVSKVETVPGYSDACLYTEDILDAAKQIQFQPALRNDEPISQRISIFYRLH